MFPYRLQIIVEDTYTNKAYLCDYILSNNMKEISPQILPAIQICCAKNNITSRTVNLDFKLYFRMREVAHSTRAVDLLETKEVRLNG